jgi:hypothetical protein
VPRLAGRRSNARGSPQFNTFENVLRIMPCSDHALGVAYLVAGRIVRGSGGAMMNGDRNAGLPTGRKFSYGSD